MTRTQVGVMVLRLGLAAVFLWFGFSQLFDGLNWVGWVPQWAVDLLHLPPAMIVLANGLFEVVCGSLLACGLFVRAVSVLLALHFTVIVFDIGLTAIGVRDFGLLVATASLAFLEDSESSARWSV